VGRLECLWSFHLEYTAIGLGHDSLVYPIPDPTTFVGKRIHIGRFCDFSENKIDVDLVGGSKMLKNLRNACTGVNQISPVQ
jgi:hypothetical protein